MIINDTISLSTRGNSQIIDITPRVREIVERTNVKNGMVGVFVPGSTGAVTTIEYESGALADLQELLDRIIPPDSSYRHNDTWGDGNGHSHLRASLLGPSLTIPLIDGALRLGTWQQVVFIDCDNRPRQRTLILQILGD